VLAVGSVLLLVGYMFLFAAVQGGRFARNPWLGVTEVYGGSGASSTPTGGAGGHLT